MAEHIFTLTASWPGGRNSVGEIASGQLQTKVSIPPEMDGPGVGTNPDEMLLGAAATCYIITLAAMLERANLETSKLTMTSEGLVDVTNGVFTYVKITHKPKIVIPSTYTEKQERQVVRLAEKAEKTCMISKAIRGNVELALEITIDYE
ncbi:OsmC family peroxiredoxin [Rummeliibacillus sp. TYF005]|uniref:OsmC family protein n=1 Tax=Rummeliibacillus sp. TYF005 TaxID=2058214 RepID=UPI000F5453D8|nr:OsmC family protein [Rummeliibacillus sp. TYF005]RPJ94067.1 OsmC family peroxiredoxin [Rummeliibacillus sp. TYF005]